MSRDVQALRDEILKEGHIQKQKSIDNQKAVQAIADVIMNLPPGYKEMFEGKYGMSLDFDYDQLVNDLQYLTNTKQRINVIADTLYDEAKVALDNAKKNV